MATSPTTASVVGATSTAAGVAVTPSRLTLTVQGPIIAGSPAYFTLDSVAGTSTTIIVAFGDGTSVALMNSDSTKVAHIYKLPGTYTVTVSVTDASGQTQSASFPVVVN